MAVRIMVGDALDSLKTLPDESVQCCVTSPPYWGLRDYGVVGQLGLEKTPDEYVARMVAVFREVRRVLRKDGTLWLNIGDSYAGSGKGGNPPESQHQKQRTNRGTVALSDYPVGSTAREAAVTNVTRLTFPDAGIKAKDLVGIPWMLAFALRADGWYLRQRLPWVKRNPMPESVEDRPASGVEDVFLLSKSERYFYDYEAVRRRMAPASLPRLAQNVEGQAGSDRANGGAKTNGTMKAVRRSDKQGGHSRRHDGFNDRWDAMEKADQQSDGRAFRNTDLFYDSIEAPFGAIGNETEIIALDVATQPYSEAHFATFPPSLIVPLIRAGTREGDTVLDPFGGAGTTGLVADRLSRNAVLCELNPEYARMAERRIKQDNPMFTEVHVA